MDGDRSALEARNAAMREQVDSLLDRFNQQTQQLQEAQAAAANATATVTSRDGSVTATVDSSGALASLEFASSSFQRSDPKQVARIVVETVRAATLEVKQQMTALMSPMTEDLPDLSEIIDGAPSLKDLMPKMPDLSNLEKPQEDGPRQSEAPSAPPRPDQPSRRPAFDDDEEPDSWLEQR